MSRILPAPLFKPWGIAAIYRGDKTQTRRVLPSAMNLASFIAGNGDDVNDPDNWGWEDPDATSEWITLADTRLAKYRGGDLLWLREQWRTIKACDHIPPRSILVHGYRAIRYEVDGSTAGWCDNDVTGKMRSPMFMPRWASRATIEITNARAERLRDISEEDARAEGCEEITKVGHNEYGDPELQLIAPATHDFFGRWEEIHGNGAAGRNPWVWAYTFKLHRCHVDEVAG